jgi:triacylglycerol lipase
MKNRAVVLFAVVAQAGFAQGAPDSQDATLLRTAHALDEARGYCIDIPGFRGTLRLEEPLQAHTCKYGEPLEDQLFEPAPQNVIRANGYDRCLEASALDEGAQLLVRTCRRSALQRWSLSSGRLHPESRSDLCVSLAGEAGQIAGTPLLITPAYRRRDLSLERCDDDLQTRQAFRWSSIGEHGASRADAARDGMADDIAARLAAFGREFSGPIAAETAEIYATVPRVYEPAEIQVTKDLAYGPDERQRLDIHTATMRSADAPVPAIVVFHGGGLTAGSRAATVNVADYFASLGYVGVNGSYRLAPDHKWPEGARDVGATVTWLRDHVAEYGGDPERIFVVGISSGSLHAATFVFRPELLPPATARPAGAILVSGPYSFDFANPSPGELAYFGEDRSRWPEMVVPGNVTRTDIPVLLTTAEWDNARYTGPFAELFRELVIEHGVAPRYHHSLGHNHSSQLWSLGTADTSVASQIVDFIERTAGR